MGVQETCPLCDSKAKTINWAELDGMVAVICTGCVLQTPSFPPYSEAVNYWNSLRRMDDGKNKPQQKKRIWPLLFKSQNS